MEKAIGDNNSAMTLEYESKLKGVYEQNKDLQTLCDSLKQANLELKDKVANLKKQLEDGAGRPVVMSDEAQKMADTIEKLIQEK